MNCRRVKELLSPYLDDRLTGAQMLDVRAHLDGCPPCFEEFRMIQQAKTMLRRVTIKEPGRHFEAHLHATIADESGSVLALAVATLNTPITTRTFTGLSYRGRRMAYAAAISCMGVFALAHGAWAPNKVDISSQPQLPIEFGQPAEAMLTSMPGKDFSQVESLHLPAMMTTTPVPFWTNRRRPVNYRRDNYLNADFTSNMPVYSPTVRFSNFISH